MMTGKWQNSAARRRAHAKFRAKLCAMVGYPVDCCATTGEVLQDARRIARRVKLTRLGNLLVNAS